MNVILNSLFHRNITQNNGTFSNILQFLNTRKAESRILGLEVPSESWQQTLGLKCWKEQVEYKACNYTVGYLCPLL